MVDPCGQRTTHADGARPSTSLASSQKSSRTGSRQCRGRRDPELCRRGRGRDRGKKEMGARNNGEKRKQHPAHCLSLPNRNRKHNTSSSSSSSNGSCSRSNAASVMTDSHVVRLGSSDSYPGTKGTCSSSCCTVRTDVAEDATEFSAVKCPLRCESLGSRLRALHWPDALPVCRADCHASGRTSTTEFFWLCRWTGRRRTW